MAKDEVIIEDDESGAVFARWVPTAVVFVAFSGFITLAWYAYHTGTQSVNEADLVVVEADKTPMKEKPLDPGGMKFMNQDKTIYDTFSSNQTNPPKVEHVMPAPEEPMAKPEEAAETKTWINDKLHQDDDTAKKSDQVLSAEKQKNMVDQKVVKPVDSPRTTQDTSITTHIADTVKKTEKKTPAAPKDEAPKFVTASNGTAKIQLGAYGSETEAKNAWEKMQKKFPELGNKTVYIVKADLGNKGVFYRLRAGGVGNAAAAKALCGRLTAKGQACLVP